MLVDVAAFAAIRYLKDDKGQIIAERFAEALVVVGEGLGLAE